MTPVTGEATAIGTGTLVKVLSGQYLLQWSRAPSLERLVTGINDCGKEKRAERQGEEPRALARRIEKESEREEKRQSQNRLRN